LGLGNTAIGTFSLFSVTTGSYNTAVGAGALDLNLGDSNTATGAAALLFNTTGTENTANGTAALEFNDSGSGNSSFGAFANTNNTASDNTSIGARTLLNNTSGGLNTAVGQAAMLSNDTGSSNVAIGVQALGNNTSGNGNIAIGNVSGPGVSTANNVICIGNVNGADVDNSCYIGNIWGQSIDPATALQVQVDEFGKLGTTTSSRRFKHDIKPMGKSSEAILALKPVTFHYKSDAKGTPEFGLIAEEVAEVNPNLVVRNKDGEIYTVRYDQVNAMLLNEFLKEHHQVQDLKAIVAEQQKQIQQLTVGLQTVNTQLKASKPAPQVVNNP
jgi:hypothetical protein